jgi:hypothetical protein
MFEAHIFGVRQSPGQWRSLTLGGMLAVGCLLAASEPMSAATILPSATSSVTCQAPFQSDISGATSCSQTSADGHGQGSISLSPFIDISVSEKNAAGSGGFSVLSNLKYSFEVIGGHVGDIVPLLIETSISTSATNATGAGSTAQIGVVTSQGSVGGTFCASVLCSAADFSGAFAINAASGSIGTIGLNANVGGGFGPIDSSAAASVDPLIFVDPSFADADLYSIVLSEGVANALPGASAVPEPSTWAMMVLGLAGFAGLRRHRGRKSEVARRSGFRFARLA